MGEVMERGVIGMPFEMAMESELSRSQFYSMAQRILSDRDALRAENDQLRAELDALKAVPEGVEVVAWMKHELCTRLYFHAPPEPSIPLMTVAQHNAIVAALRQPVAGEREAFELNAKYGEALQVLRELLDEAESIPSEIEWKALRVVQGRRVYVDDRTALSAPAAGQDVSALVEALEFYARGDHLMLADPDAWDTCSGEPVNWLHDDEGTASVEDGSLAKAALAAHKAGGVQ